MLATNNAKPTQTTRGISTIEFLLELLYLPQSLEIHSRLICKEHENVLASSCVV